MTMVVASKGSVRDREEHLGLVCLCHNLRDMVPKSLLMVPTRCCDHSLQTEVVAHAEGKMDGLSLSGEVGDSC